MDEQINELLGDDNEEVPHDSIMDDSEEEEDEVNDLLADADA